MLYDNLRAAGSKSYCRVRCRFDNVRVPRENLLNAVADADCRWAVHERHQRP